MRFSLKLVLFYVLIVYVVLCPGGCVLQGALYKTSGVFLLGIFKTTELCLFWRVASSNWPGSVLSDLSIYFR